MDQLQDTRPLGTAGQDTLSSSLGIWSTASSWGQRLAQRPLAQLAKLISNPGSASSVEPWDSGVSSSMLVLQ